MSDEFSPEQLAQLRAAFREELADAGLRIDGADHVDAAREDFRFLRKLRLMWDGAVVRTGTWVLAGILGIVATIVTLGFWSWINRGGQ